MSTAGRPSNSTPLSRLAQWAQASEARKARGLVLLTLVVYLPAFAGGFVWDDVILVTEPLIRRVDGIVSIWFAPSELKHEFHYWPVTYTSFWIEHKLWGLHPAGYHAVNIILHALNSVLVWRLLVRLAVPWAWFVAAVFAVHPVHVESVAWIIERKDLLSALFFLAAVHVWLRFTEAPGSGRYLLCLALFVLALLSKSIAVTLPATLLLIQWWRHGRVTWRDAARAAPFFAVAANVTLADLALYRNSAYFPFDYSFVERSLIASRALWVYMHQLAWPVHLPVFYPRWEVHAGDAPGWLALAALVSLGVMLWCARARLGRGPAVVGLFFALTLSPVLGFVDFSFMRIAFVADRFQYLASIGPLALAGAVVHAVVRRRFLRQPLGHAGAVAVAAALLLALSVLSWRQAGIYRDDLAFARHVAALSPRHYFGQLFLSGALNGSGYHEEGLGAARRAVDLSRGLRGLAQGEVDLALAGALLGQEHPVEAEVVLRRSLASSPRGRKSERRLELARSLVRQARYDEGLELYRELVEDEPGNDVAHLQMGLAYLESGRYEAAVESFSRALPVVRHPDNEPALHALTGGALHKLGRLDAAAVRLDEALALKPGNIRFLLARADLEADRIRDGSSSSGDGGNLAVQGSITRTDEVAAGPGAWLAEAQDHCNALIEHEPEHPLARVLLGAVLLRLEQYDAAEAALDHAFSLAPSRPLAREAHRVMGQIREQQGRTEDAARHYQSALDIYPLDSEALHRLAAIRSEAARYEDALPLYRRLVKATPFVVQAHLHLGMTLRRLGRFAEALSVVDRALELAPGLEEARGLDEQIREELRLPPR